MNLDDLTIIGQGSEWFWSMAQFLVVVVSLYAIYRQVRFQASAAALQQMDAITKEWRSEESVRHTLAIELAVRDGAPLEDVPYGAASAIGDFWTGIGYLIRHRHIDYKLFADNLGGSILWWWTMLEPWTKRIRGEGFRGALEDFEWLAGRIRDDSEPDAPVFDEAFIRSTLERRIENDLDRLRVAEAIRGVAASTTTLPTPPKRRSRTGQDGKSAASPK